MIKIYIAILLFIALPAISQKSKPKLIVGIVVDQMRPDYLSRFYNQFGEKGFKRLLNQGFYCANTQIDYYPTVTAAGHASIYSGTTPKYHGIIENDWFDRKLKNLVYCAFDSLEKTVGNSYPSKYSFSARNLMVTNISDELKLSTNGKGKVIAMSLKDRGATMPAGHLADGAYWFDQVTGNFVSSTYYIKELPEWVKQFNSQNFAAKYIETNWDLKYLIDSYNMSISDDNPYETILPGKTKPVFPYNLKEISNLKHKSYYGIYFSPAGNTILADFAIDAIKNAGLGNDDYPDILAISFSSTDATGHLFGPQSLELNDMYIRLDYEISRILDALDHQIGKNNYVLFLTADHGAGEIPNYLSKLKIPAGYIDSTQIINNLKKNYILKYRSDSILQFYLTGQIYLNHSYILTHHLNKNDVELFTDSILRKTEGVFDVFTSDKLMQNNLNEIVSQKVLKGYMPERSGDVLFILKPNWNEKSDYASTHGSPYTFDSHIPLIWFGKGILKGKSYSLYHITDIAPTLSEILDIKLPGFCVGNPITEIMKN